VWRGEHYACTHSEYLQVKRQLMAEMHGGLAAAAAAAAGGDGDGGPRSWAELSSEEQGKLLKERLKKYTQKVCVCVCGRGASASELGCMFTCQVSCGVVWVLLCVASAL
jgi:DNA polymerase epsilon subunit 1